MTETVIITKTLWEGIIAMLDHYKACVRKDLGGCMYCTIGEDVIREAKEVRP